jgi:hypothetical protein
MTMSSFDHLVEVDEQNRTVRITRLYSDGRRQLFTEVHIPEKRPKAVEAELLQRLGENILLDSPAGRALLGE